MKLMRFTTYRQLDMMDCGPTCLKMVLKHYGKQVNLESIKRETELGTDGVSLLGMSQAAEKFGLKTISTKITFNQLLNDAPLPCVLHWNQNHYVVLTPSASKKKLVIADPAKGLITYTRQEFLKNWISTNREDEQKGIALLLKPGAHFFESKNDDREKAPGWHLFTKYLSAYKTNIFQLLIGLFFGSVVQLIFPYLTQSIVDTGIATQNIHFIQIILLAQFMLFFARTVVEFIRVRILVFVSTQINLSILSDFWIKLMRLPLHFFYTKQTGDILQRIQDHKRIESFITGTALTTLFSIFNLLVFSVVLFVYSTTIFLIFVGGSILYFLWINIFLKYRRDIEQKRFTLTSKETSTTMQLINGMHEIKLNNAEHPKRWEWEGLQASLFNLNIKTISVNQYQQAGAVFINEGKNILITFLVSTAVLDGHLTLGAMLAIQYIIGQLNSPVEQLATFSQQAQDAKISLERLNEIHHLEDEEPTDRSFINHISDTHGITLKNLTFAYPGAGNKPVLSDLNIDFAVGKVTAIVGTSGSGKTTILKLLQKFYDNYSGEIKIGGTNLKSLGAHYWRSVSASVMQEGYIFSDTIEKNITMGDENVDYKRLIHACKVANVMTFIDILPLGFNTKIGMDGNGISAGQKQRILIARAVYKNPSFLFFDESTNALDANNEKVIIENLQEFFEGKTVLIIAHRLSTVKNADKIIVIDNGVVIEEGTHEELVSKKEKYYELVKNQLELGN